MNGDAECPYCGEWVEICHDDGYGYEEDTKHEQYCGHCDKSFVYETSIHFSYSTSKADCLNGLDHNYSLTQTIPEFFTRMRCVDCDKERQLTDEEREIYNIPKYKEPTND